MFPSACWQEEVFDPVMAGGSLCLWRVWQLAQKGHVGAGRNWQEVVFESALAASLFSKLNTSPSPVAVVKFATDEPHLFSTCSGQVCN